MVILNLKLWMLFIIIYEWLDFNFYLLILGGRIFMDIFFYCLKWLNEREVKVWVFILKYLDKIFWFFFLVFCMYWKMFSVCWVICNMFCMRLVESISCWIGFYNVKNVWGFWRIFLNLIFLYVIFLLVGIVMYLLIFLLMIIIFFLGFRNW